MILHRQIEVCRAVGAKIAINVVNFWSIFANLIEMASTMLNHYKCIDLAWFACYSYNRNREGVGGGMNGKHNSSKSR